MDMSGLDQLGFAAAYKIAIVWNQVVNEWLRPEEVLREQGQNSRPCLFAGPANPSDVCQV